MKRLLLAAGIVLAFATPAQAQTRIEIDCDSVDVIFQTSIQPDSATVEITSNAGTETHNPTLVQGGSTVSFPLDGQNGESVTVNVTLVHAGISNTTSASEVLEGCAVPSPSPSPTVSPESSPSPIATADAPAVTPGASPSPESPEPIEEAAEGSVETRTVEQPPLPEELAFTGAAGTWFAVAISLFAGGLAMRVMGGLRSRKAR